MNSAKVIGTWLVILSSVMGYGGRENFTVKNETRDPLEKTCQYFVIGTK